MFNENFPFGDEVFMSDKPMTDAEFGSSAKTLEFSEVDKVPHLVLFRGVWQVVYWHGDAWGWCSHTGDYVGDEHPRRNPGFDYCKPVRDLVPNAELRGRPLADGPA